MSDITTTLQDWIRARGSFASHLWQEAGSKTSFFAGNPALRQGTPIEGFSLPARIGTVEFSVCGAAWNSNLHGAPGETWLHDQVP